MSPFVFFIVFLFVELSWWLVSWDLDCGRVADVGFLMAGIVRFWSCFWGMLGWGIELKVCSQP